MLFLPCSRCWCKGGRRGDRAQLHEKRPNPYLPFSLFDATAAPAGRCNRRPPGAMTATTGCGGAPSCNRRVFFAGTGRRKAATHTNQCWDRTTVEAFLLAPAILFGYNRLKPTTAASRGGDAGNVATTITTCWNGAMSFATTGDPIFCGVGLSGDFFAVYRRWRIFATIN